MEALIAAALHDIKNELQALEATLLAAQHEAPSPALGEARGIASDVGVKLVELLAVFRASQGRLDLPIGRHVLTEFIDELRIEPLHVHDAGNRIDIAWDVAAAETIGEADLDAYPVKLVLLDALRNAVGHARARVVFAVSPAAGGGVEFSISDDGAGFPAGVLVGEDTPMTPGHSGIGLLFARLIAARHVTPGGREGRLLLDNAGLEGGARFRLVLP